MARMYLRHTTRKKDGKVHRYWRLVRSVRVGRRVIQPTVAQLGELDEHGRLAARALARHLIGTPEQARLFDESIGIIKHLFAGRARSSPRPTPAFGVRADAPAVGCAFRARPCHPASRHYGRARRRSRGGSS